MPAKKAVPAKRGRKPAVPGAKLAQLTIRLAPTQRLALELLSRQTGLSLSQVVEKAVGEAVNSWPIEGVGAVQHVLRWADRNKPSDILRVEAIAEEVLDSEPLFITQLPRSLLREHEKLFREVFSVLLSKKEFLYPANGPEADDLLELCKVAFRSGLSASDVLEHWRELQAETRR